jgi:serine/threonine protein phosphatase PrpC
MAEGNYVLASSHEEMNPNRRHTMEDVHRIVPTLCGDETLSYFAVYDGHGGKQDQRPASDDTSS